MIYLIIYFVLNIIITIGINNEGNIISSDLNKKEKWFFNILTLLFGVISVIFVLIVAESTPILVRYKWYKRQRKIRKSILNKEKREQPQDIGIGIF